MGASRAGSLRWALLAAVLALALAAPLTGSAQEPARSKNMSWETGEGRNWAIPSVEIAGFIAGLNLFNRLFIDPDEYGSDWQSMKDNLTNGLVIDDDPFSINQIGHPYQGGIYYGFARSAGLSYWESAAYTIAGSLLWEAVGETTPPSLNDTITTGIGGSFVGEALFRMASLLLEGGGERPGFWRELGAAAISPPTGFNRLVFGDRFDAVFPSHKPANFIRLRLGATLTTDVNTGGLTDDVEIWEGILDYSMIYGLPGKPGYKYTRPFDFFQFDITAITNADPISNLIENAAIRGLLLGTDYALGEDYRGLWGLFGIFEYLSPQIFRVSTTALALGTVGQWWLARGVALQGTILGGLGFGAAGTVGDQAERDYHYGLIPEALVGLRLIFGERVMIDATGRQYYVAGQGAGGGITTNDIGGEIITRVNVGFTLRVLGPHGIGVQYTYSGRDTSVAGLGDRRQRIETVSFTYSFLGHTRFGAVEWRPEQLAAR